MCRLYLGLTKPISFCEDAVDELCSLLKDYLADCGNFGHKKGVSGTIECVATNMQRNGIFYTLQKQGMHNWKAYQRHHWLKPFCWIYQSGRYIKKGIATKRNVRQLNTVLNESARRTELLSKLGI